MSGESAREHAEARAAAGAPDDGSAAERGVEARTARRRELEALRIDAAMRAGPGRRRRRRWARPTAVLLVVLAAAAAAAQWRHTRPLPVEVAYATVLEPGQSISGPVLAGSGYVVTGDKYISVG